MLLVAALHAHHGSSDYRVDREITVTGTVTQWRWVNPHVRVVVAVTARDGKVEEWDCEGPPLTWAAQRGWSQSTLRAGETIALVMYPLKQGSPGGLIKRIQRGGDVLVVSRPWLDER